MLGIWDKIKELLKRREDKTPPGVKVVTRPMPLGDPKEPKGTKLVLQPCSSQLPVA